MTTIVFPAEIPAEALRRAMATLGLVIDGRQQADGSHRAVWASESVRDLFASHPCSEPTCLGKAAVRIGGHLYCAQHAVAVARQEGAL